MRRSAHAQATGAIVSFVRQEVITVNRVDCTALPIFIVLRFGSMGCSCCGPLVVRCVSCLDARSLRPDVVINLCLRPDMSPACRLRYSRDARRRQRRALLRSGVARALTSPGRGGRPVTGRDIEAFSPVGPRNRLPTGALETEVAEGAALFRPTGPLA